MADRFFPNEWSDGGEEEGAASDPRPSLPLLRLPPSSFSERLMNAGLRLKDTVVKETWGKSRRRLLKDDYTLYTGALGTAYLAFKAYLVTRCQDDLRLCSEIVQSCDAASRDSGRVTFMCGRSGVCALGAVVAKHAGDERLLQAYLARFKEILLRIDLPNELLYGRAGYLWACSYLNEHVGPGTVSPAHMRAVVDDMIKHGRQLARGGECPLMYEWHGKKYWGSAHGLAGIMHVLMDMELKSDEAEDVKDTLRYMMRNRFASGNYRSSEGSESDRLVHWCHGAPGVSLTLTKAAQVFRSEEFKQAAIDAAELVWLRGLLKRVGLCHGISGNAYVFLSLYGWTGDRKYLHRAKVFASFLHERALELISQGKMHGGDRPFSLFEGVGGMSYLFMDMVDPSTARFPSYEL
ncbi:hypothetical protein MLD38_022004 [Melastoma candidum]|uniref:Uncharacterized protein n=1 Tax=Melastoma candidum TaxID=119954 RepID=A0ACB9QIB9_9MYRT|nr:hypothetical protein MLD38_022004 [Melastoma candidum]